jgi:ribosomal protein S18 acetylase RimI-like enzyme
MRIQIVPIVVRTIETNDLEAFYKLRMKAITEEPFSFGADISKWKALSLAAVETAVSTPDGSFVLGAYDEETLCGFLCFSIKSPKSCSHKGILWGMYVSPQFRGRGIGSSLLNQLKSICKSRGTVAINLVVFESNKTARSLYLKNGFTQFAVERQACKIDGILLDENWLECRL